VRNESIDSNLLLTATSRIAWVSRERVENSLQGFATWNGGNAATSQALWTMTYLALHAPLVFCEAEFKAAGRLPFLTLRRITQGYRYCDGVGKQASEISRFLSGGGIIGT
jgi:hypothetical protein